MDQKIQLNLKIQYKQGVKFIILALLSLLLTVSPTYLFTYVSQANPIGGITATEFSPNLKAFLDTIAWAEGTAKTNGYKMIFGGTIVNNTSRHPNICVPYRNTCSTAAGRYQFLNTTWNNLKNQLGLRDFSPRSQDLGARKLIADRGALNDVEAGRFETAIYKVAREWASLPTNANSGSAYGQPSQRINDLRSTYNRALAIYQGQSITTPPPLRTCNTVLFGDCIDDQGRTHTIIIPSCDVALFGICED